MKIEVARQREREREKHKLNNGDSEKLFSVIDCSAS
jgi:hypothetical protein